MSKAAFYKWWEDERKEKSGTPRRPTRGEIWDYFHREFPREALQQIITGIPNFRILKSSDLSAIFCQIERLWPSGEEIDIGKQYDSMFGVKPDCTTCGGSREVACDVRYPDRDCAGHTVPCPDCTERPKCPTCGGSTKVPIIVGHQCTVFPCYHVRKSCPDCTEKPKCPTCGGSGKTTTTWRGETVNGDDCPDCTEKPERTDKEDPIFSGDNSVDMWAEINGANTKVKLRRALYLVCCRLQDFEARVDRRTGDQRKEPEERRSKILVGSLKAMRSQN